MNKYKVDKLNFSFIFSLVAVVLVIVMGIGLSTRLALIEQRNNLLLSNTMSLVDNITRVLSSLESDKVINQLTTNVGALKKENEGLRLQVKNSERELKSAALKEKKCQEQLSRLSGKPIEPAGKQIKGAAGKKAGAENRGFLIKNGKTQ